MPSPNATTTTTCPDDVASLKRVFLPAAYGLLFAVGLVGNIAALGVYVAVLRPWKSSGVIMVNLALADLLHMLTLPFLVRYYDRGEVWDTGALTCYLVRFAFYLHLYSSVLILTCLAAFRWLVVARPLLGAQVQRCSWGLAACAAAWAAAVAGVAPMWSVLCFEEVNNRTVCHDFASRTPVCYNWLLTVFGFLLPLTTVAACAKGVARKLATGPCTAGPRSRRARARARARWLTLAVLAGFAVCFLPYHVLRALRVETLRAPGQWSCGARRGVRAAYVVTRPLAAASTLFNLGLNTLAGGRFQRAAVRILRAGWLRRNGAPPGGAPPGGALPGGALQGVGKERGVTAAAVRWRDATNTNHQGVEVGMKTRL